MGRDTDLVDDAGNHGLNACLLIAAQRGDFLVLPATNLLQPLHQSGHIAGFQHEIPRPQIGCSGRHIFGDKCRCNQSGRVMIGGGQCLEDADSIPLGKHQIQHQNLGFEFCDAAQGSFSIAGCAHHMESLGLLQGTRQMGAKFLRAVCNKNGSSFIHNKTLLSCVNFAQGISPETTGIS